MGKNSRNPNKDAEYLVGLACDPGTLAMPNALARNSYYTEALLQHLPVAGRTLEETMRVVGNDVYLKTRKKQRPWFNSCMLEHVVLAP